MGFIAGAIIALGYSIYKGLSEIADAIKELTNKDNNDKES